MNAHLQCKSSKRLLPILQRRYMRTALANFNITYKHVKCESRQPHAFEGLGVKRNSIVGVGDNSLLIF